MKKKWTLSKATTLALFGLVMVSMPGQWKVAASQGPPPPPTMPFEPTLHAELIDAMVQCIDYDPYLTGDHTSCPPPLPPMDEWNTMFLSGPLDNRELQSADNICLVLGGYKISLLTLTRASPPVPPLSLLTPSSDA